MDHPQHPWIGLEHAPIYAWRLPAETNDEDLAACLEAREVWAPTVNWPTAWVVDLSNVHKATARQRKMFAKHLDAMADYDKQWNAGSGLYVKSPFIRGIVTAVYWLSPPVYPHEFFADEASALAYAKNQLGQAEDKLLKIG